MLQKLDFNAGNAYRSINAAAAASEGFADVLMRSLRRRYKIALAGFALALVLAGAYIALSEPLYTSSSYLLIDTRRISGLEDSSQSATDTVDDSTIDSQVEVILSEKSLLKVIDKLKLPENETFDPKRPGMFARFFGFGGREMAKMDTLGPDAQFLRQREVLNILLEHVNVRRIGRTYVLNVAYTSPDPKLAAAVANGIAEQYLSDQLESKYDSMQRAGDWLQQRITELRDQSIKADIAVQKFKAENNLISSGGVLMNEQQMGELNTELVKVTSDTAQAEARYRRIKSIVDTGAVDAAVTESIDNPVIIDLRGKYLETSRRLEDINHRLGTDSDASRSLKRQMDEYNRLIFTELGRIAESYQSEYQIARDKQTSLENSLAGVVDSNAESNEKQVQLRELERESETFKNIYTTFLQRYQQTLQQQSFPITEARIITSAVPSIAPSTPNTNLILTFGGMLGLILGVSAASFIDYRDRAFRNGTQIKDELGKEFFGMMWTVKGRRTRIPHSGAGDTSLLRPTNSIYQHAIENPLTPNAETLRSVKVAMDLAFHDKKSKVIGVASVLPGEGKTTVAKNLASLLASSGQPTILIDCDMRNPSLTRAVASHAKEGLVEAITEGRPLQELLKVETGTGLHMLPCVVTKRLFYTSELLSSRAMDEILDWARANYSYVILDLSPLAPVVDVRVMERQVDGFVFVVKWGSTPRRVVRSVMMKDRAIMDKCLGILLNQADPKRAAAYQSLDDKERFMGTYSNYYVDQA